MRLRGIVCHLGASIAYFFPRKMATMALEWTVRQKAAPLGICAAADLVFGKMTKRLGTER
jgi:hypothetical protein